MNKGLCLPILQCQLSYGSFLLKLDEYTEVRLFLKERKMQLMCGNMCQSRSYFDLTVLFRTYTPPSEVKMFQRHQEAKRNKKSKSYEQQHFVER